MKNYLIDNKYGKCYLFPKQQDDDQYDRYSLVNGIVNKPNLEYYSCYIARKFDDMCGKEGTRYIEKKNGRL
jgi:hypothetical protein